MLPADWLTDLLYVAAAIAATYTLYRVLRPRFGARFASPADAEARTRDLLDRHQREMPDAGRPQPPAALSLRLLKAAHSTDRDVTCLIVNEGDTVLNLSVTARNGVDVEINPKKIAARQTGSIKLHFPPGYASGLVPFDVQFDDATGLRTSERYVYVILEKRLVYEPGGLQ